MFKLCKAIKVYYFENFILCKTNQGNLNLNEMGCYLKKTLTRFVAADDLS